MLYLLCTLYENLLQNNKNVLQIIKILIYY